MKYLVKEMLQFPFGHGPASHLRLTFHGNKHQGRDAPHVKGLHQLLFPIAIGAMVLHGTHQFV